MLRRTYLICHKIFWVSLHFSNYNLWPFHFNRKITTSKYLKYVSIRIRSQLRMVTIHPQVEANKTFLGLKSFSLFFFKFSWIINFWKTIFILIRFHILMKCQETVIICHTFKRFFLPLFVCIYKKKVFHIFWTYF